MQMKWKIKAYKKLVQKSKLPTELDEDCRLSSKLSERNRILSSRLDEVRFLISRSTSVEITNFLRARQGELELDLSNVKNLSRKTISKPVFECERKSDGVLFLQDDVNLVEVDKRTPMECEIRPNQNEYDREIECLKNAENHKIPDEETSPRSTLVPMEERELIAEERSIVSSLTGSLQSTEVPSFQPTVPLLIPQNKRSASSMTDSEYPQKQMRIEPPMRIAVMDTWQQLLDSPSYRNCPMPLTNIQASGLSTEKPNISPAELHPVNRECLNSTSTHLVHKVADGCPVAAEKDTNKLSLNEVNDDGINDCVCICEEIPSIVLADSVSIEDSNESALNEINADSDNDCILICKELPVVVIEDSATREDSDVLPENEASVDTDNDCTIIHDEIPLIMLDEDGSVIKEENVRMEDKIILYKEIHMTANVNECIAVTDHPCTNVLPLKSTILLQTQNHSQLKRTTRNKVLQIPIMKAIKDLKQKYDKLQSCKRSKKISKYLQERFSSHSCKYMPVLVNEDAKVLSKIKDHSNNASGFNEGQCHDGNQGTAPMDLTVKEKKHCQNLREMQKQFDHLAKLLYNCSQEERKIYLVQKLEYELEMWKAFKEFFLPLTKTCQRTTEKELNELDLLITSCTVEKERRSLIALKDCIQHMLSYTSVPNPKRCEIAGVKTQNKSLAQLLQKIKDLLRICSSVEEKNILLDMRSELELQTKQLSFRRRILKCKCN